MKKILILMMTLMIVLGGFLFWLFAREEGAVPILVYHQVNDIDKNQMTVTVEDFDAQMKYLVDSGYTFITPEDLINAWGVDLEGDFSNTDRTSESIDNIDSEYSLPKKPIIVTFDDGYVDMYKNVYPILQKYNAKITLFVITDYLNLYPNYLTWAQARELQSSGLVDVESHTLSHSSLVDKRITRNEIVNQLYGSRQAIEWYLKKPAKYIAYPGGFYTREVEEISKEFGYNAAFTIDYGLSHNLPQHYVLPRIPIFGNNSYPMLRFKIRLILAPIIAPIYRFKNQLIADGNGAVADFIWIP